MSIQTNLCILFAMIVSLFLIVDLGFLNRKSAKVEFSAAIKQTLFWVAITFAFGFLVFLYMGRELATEFMSAYVTEELLSVDNLFVLMLIFSYFKLEEKYHHRVLFYGILGAIVFRGVFIAAGATLISHFHWVLYIFGFILVYTGIGLLREKKEEHVDYSKNKVVRLARRFLPFTNSHHQGRFFVREWGGFKFTPLFLIVILVEVTDIIFAVDSIPAVFAISQTPFIVYTSNIFAILGLRSLFFVIEGVMHRFHHLQKGLAFILVFIGLKMLLDIFEIHISSLASFTVIMAALFVSLAASLAFPKKL